MLGHDAHTEIVRTGRLGGTHTVWRANWHAEGLRAPLYDKGHATIVDSSPPRF